MTGASRVRARIIVFLALVAVYVLTFDYRPITDTRLNDFQTRALVLHGDINLARYGEFRGHFVERRGDHVYSIYGVGVSLVAAPIYAVLLRLDVGEANLQGSAAIPFAAGAALVLFLLMLRLVPARLAAAGAVLFAFGTTMWPVASTGFWQHAPVAFFQALGLAALFSRNPRAPAWAGLALGTATFLRPPAIILLGVLGLFYLTRGRRSAALYALGAFAPIAGVLVQNRWIWGSWTKGGYSFAGVGFHANMARAGFGLTFGWWRGLFVYSPVLILAVAGLVIAMRSVRGFVEQRLTVLGIAAVATIAFYARWSTWHGGGGQFGYRYLLDVVPSLTLLGVFAVSKWRRLGPVAIPLGLFSIGTMAVGMSPNRDHWDPVAFPKALGASPIGRAWSHAWDDPVALVLRLVLVALAGAVLIYFASRVRAREAPIEAGPGVYT
jgi:hypothetical protein